MIATRAAQRKTTSPVRRTILTFACILWLSPSVFSNEISDQWRYAVRKPNAGWQQPGFDASTWKEGAGGFGTRGTPGSRIGTNWNTKNIWLRKSFTLATVPQQSALLIHHDEDAEVYLNGQLVAELNGWSTQYEVFPLGVDARQALRVGKNLLAVHCRQESGGQFIDVHVIDAKHVPQLPRPQRATKPFVSKLITKWGAQVTADNAWTEYPRPRLVRDAWLNLNGNWDYAITPVGQMEVPAEWEGKILVPYCLESHLSGVQRLLDATEALWYRRTFTVPVESGRRTLLNFEAVDYRCEVRVNGKPAGMHQGGNTPFVIDVTELVQPGANDLIVRVEDETEGWQLHGKQVLDARGIWYTQVSGIWQTVWLEQVNGDYIVDLKVATDAATGIIHVLPKVAGPTADRNLRIVVKDGDAVVAQTTGVIAPMSITVPDAKLWSPASPFLYDLEITLCDAQGSIVDRVKSYVGIRTVGKKRDSDGHWRFTLNGDQIFHFGPLDQGWWPDGLLTPPSDEALLFDIGFLKAAGFNTIRKHIKVEPRRYYYHCDRLGMMLWQDQVSAGHNPPWTRLKPDPKDAEWPAEHHKQFMLELERMIDDLESHPSIVVWVPFNEAWGQHETVKVGYWVSQRDPTRLVNIASGGNFWPAGDIVDAHKYPHPGFPFEPGRYDKFIKVVGEFGGHGYPVKGHLWDAARRNWGYGGLPDNKEEYKKRYVTSIDMLKDLQQRGIAAGIYTQTTDVEGEINGLMTYDRKVMKIPPEELAEINQRLFEQ